MHGCWLKLQFCGLGFDTFLHYGRMEGCLVFVLLSEPTSVVGVKWRQEAAVRYHAQEGPAGTT